MDPKSLAASALAALAPVWPAAPAMQTLLDAANWRPDLCEAVAKLVAQAALGRKDRSEAAGFAAAHDALAALREREARDRAAERGERPESA